MKHSAQLFAILFILFPVFNSCVSSFNGKPVYGNHQLVNQQFNIEDYETVVMNIPGEVFYQQFSDSTPYLQIHTDENIMKSLNVRVENNQLIIEAKKDSVIKPSQLTIYTCSHNLSRVKLIGPGELRLKGEVNAKNFALDLIGSGNFLADSLLCDQLTAKILGSGNAQLTGASNSSSLKVMGSGDIHAYNYLIQKLNCEIFGSGNIEALVTKSMDVHIAGSGNLSYRGDPESINKKITGSGKMTATN